jgi:two-component system osmolarity sensor histidine kinase EnvZ
MQLKEPNFIRKRLPKDLFGRVLLIIILPIVIMQMAVAYFFFNAHWTTVTSNLSASVSGDIAVAVELYKQSPSETRAAMLDDMLRPSMELSVALEPDDTLPETNRRAFFSILDTTLRRALNDALNDEFWFDTTRYPNHIDIRVKVDEGVLRFFAARERVFAPTGYVFIFWLVTATILLTLVSILFIRNQARPIAELAEAANRFGRGQDTQDFKPSGAAEVRLAGQSFLRMRRRITRFIDQRTVFLAGVSHDLRTPLTRLKLFLALQDETAEVSAAKRDLKDMETMLNGYLDFAQGLTDETATETNLAEFLGKIVEKLYLHTTVLTVEEDLSAPIKPLALERAVTNLINNAQDFADEVSVSATHSSGFIHIDIDDDGPGISEEKIEDALKPFNRLDPSRNQNRDGVGLGLSITRDIVQSHGGSLDLSRSEMGGLKARIRLPA